MLTVKLVYKLKHVSDDLKWATNTHRALCRIKLLPVTCFGLPVTCFGGHVDVNCKDSL